MNNQMIEKVAKAIWHTQWEEPWPREGGIEHAHALEIARAAIAAYNPDERLREALEAALAILNDTSLPDIVRVFDARSALSPLLQGDDT